MIVLEKELAFREPIKLFANVIKDLMELIARKKAALMIAIVMEYVLMKNVFAKKDLLERLVMFKSVKIIATIKVIVEMGNVIVKKALWEM